MRLAKFSFIKFTLGLLAVSFALSSTEQLLYAFDFSILKKIACIPAFHKLPRAKPEHGYERKRARELEWLEHIGETQPTVAHRLLAWAQEDPSAVAQRYKETPAGPWKNITVEEYLTRVLKLAHFLDERGFNESDFIIIESRARPEWAHLALAGQLLRGISGGAYDGSTAEEMALVLDTTQASTVAVQDIAAARKFFGEGFDRLPAHVKTVFIIEGDAPVDDGRFVTYQNALDAYGDVFEMVPFDESQVFTDFEAYLNHIKPDDLAFVFSTSGTTGEPKSAVWTHAGMQANTDEILEIFAGIMPVQGGRLYNFLPMNHIVESIHGFGVGISTRATQNYYSGSEHRRPREIQETKPTAALFPPGVWEAIKQKVLVKVKLKSEKEQRIFAWAHEVGVRVNTKRLNGEPISWREWRDLLIADALVLRDIRDNQLGLGEARALLTGSAPIQPSTLEWFRGIGLFIQNALGQTETGVTFMVQPFTVDDNTVGFPVGSTQITIDEDTSLLIEQGEKTAVGYISKTAVLAGTVVDYDLTREKLLSEGRINTGDSFLQTPDGYIPKGRLQGGIKDDRGKYWLAEPIQEKLEGITVDGMRVIQTAAVVGTSRPYRTALVVLTDEFRAALEDIETDELGTVANAEAIELLKREIRRINKELAADDTPGVGKVRKVAILAEPFSQGKHITRTRKVRRPAIEGDENFGPIIERMYTKERDDED